LVIETKVYMSTEF